MQCSIKSFAAFLKSTAASEAPPIFKTCVLFDKYDEVKLMLGEYSSCIDNETVSRAISMSCEKQNLGMFVILINHVYPPNSKIPVTMLTQFLKIPYFVQFVMDHFGITIDKVLANDLVNVAISGNNKSLFEYLIRRDIQDFVSDYKYVIIASGAGRNDILLQFIGIVKEVADECVETAYLSQQKDTVKFLLSHVTITNGFLLERIKGTCGCGFGH